MPSSNVWRRAFALFALSSALTAAQGCSDQASAPSCTPGAGHFGDICCAATGCGAGLACSAGQCTKACKTTADCDALAPDGGAVGCTSGFCVTPRAANVTTTGAGTGGW
jgi:hypothetical protein